MLALGSRSRSIASRLSNRKRRVVDWFLLDGWRYTVTALVLAALFALSATLEWAGAVPLEEPMVLFYLFSSFVGGNFTLIMVVVSINQLLLSQELGSPGELREQMQNAVEYRSKVESASGREVVPVDPQGFMAVLLANTRVEAEELKDGAIERERSEASADIEPLVSALIEHIEKVEAHLERTDTGIFNALTVTLSTNYADQINDARWIKAEHEDLSIGTRDSIDRIIDRLQEIDVARQYFKSIYLEDGLSELSRMLFYVGLPSQVVVTAAMMAMTASDPGTVVSARPTVSVVVVAGFVPLVVLFAYILRMASVTQRTVATVPFTTPRQEK